MPTSAISPPHKSRRNRSHQSGNRWNNTNHLTRLEEHPKLKSFVNDKLTTRKRVLLLRERRYLKGVVEISHSKTFAGLWLDNIAILEKLTSQQTLLSYATLRGLITVFEHLLDRHGTESKSKNDLRTSSHSSPGSLRGPRLRVLIDVYRCEFPSHSSLAGSIYVDVPIRFSISWWSPQQQFSWLVFSLLSITTITIVRSRLLLFSLRFKLAAKGKCVVKGLRMCFDSSSRHLVLNLLRSKWVDRIWAIELWNES